MPSRYTTFYEKLKKPSEIDDFRKKYREVGSEITKSSADTKPNWMHDLILFLQKYKFKPIGYGAAAGVFQSPNYPFVLKVFRKDDAYVKWAQFAISNQDNPYVPKIKGRVVKITDAFFAIRLEPLNPIDYDNYHEIDDAIGFHMDYVYDGTTPETADPHLLKIAEFLVQYEKALDLHKGNYMQRPDGSPVVVDPLYNFFRQGKFAIPS